MHGRHHFSDLKEGTVIAEFQDVYKQYAKRVYRFLLSLCGDSDMAEELMQETFYRAFLHLNRFEGKCSLFTYLCQIGKNAWMKECKRQKRFGKDDISGFKLADPSSSPEEKAVDSDSARRIRQAVYNLKEPYQNVFILRVYGERKYADIGALYGKSENWARVTYFRAKAQICEEVKL